MAKFAALLGLVCLAGVALAFPGTAIVSPSLVAKFTNSEKQSIAVLMKTDVSPAYKAIEANGKTYSVRGQKMTDLRQALIEHTASTQTSLRSFLDSKSVSYKPYWITNRLIIKDASYQLVKELSVHPDVAEIREEIVIQLEKPTVSQPFEGKQDDDRYVRGVFVVGAPTLWEQGNHGEGIIVSNIDTGVRGTHEALRDNFVGEFGWYDPTANKAEPYDEQGHGTHTMGTIAGHLGYGVAPGAKWMACLACVPFGCYEEDLLACAQFISCPHNAQGNSDCSKAPHVTSNSWGGSGGQTWFDDAIDAFKVAGVIPVFSAGNDGSSCNTVGSPGDRDVIGVAATTFEDEIADFSSRGPATSGLHKPDISAPGVDVLSAWYNADNQYNAISGTSMACPHVSGGVALLLNAKPELIGDFEGVKDALLSTAYKTNLLGAGQNCGQISDDVFPNHVFGSGRLDLPAATAMSANATRY